jgi:disulfide bond formation protein DsbB
LLQSALVLATIALLGSLWLSVGLGLKAGPLCVYQRTFLMGTVAILGFGVYMNIVPTRLLSLLALPLPLAGFLVAGYHVILEATGFLECPPGLLNLGTAPQQSATAFTLLLLLVATAAGVAEPSQTTRQGMPVLMAFIGLFFGVMSIFSAPAFPPAPGEPYTMPLDACRVPYWEPAGPESKRPND